MATAWISPQLLSSLLTGVAVVLLLVVLRRFYLAHQARATAQWRASMDALFWWADPVRLFRLHIALAAVLPVAAWWASSSWLLACLVAWAVALAPRVLQSRLHARRRERLVAQLPDALALLAGALRAGSSLQTALALTVRESPDPLAQEMSLVLREQRLGMNLDDALNAMRDRLAFEGMDLFVSALTLAREVGGNLAEVLDRLASSLRTQAALEGKVRALTAQGKLQGWVVGLLPLVLAMVLGVLDPQFLQPWFDTASGLWVMAAVVCLLAVGGWSIRRIVKVDL